MVRILFMTEDRSGLVALNWLHHLEQAVAKYAECKWAGPRHPLHERDETLNETVERVMPNADWVFKGGIGPKRDPPKNKDYKVALYTSDIHYSLSLRMGPPRMVKRMNEAGYDAFMMAYTKLAAQVMPDKTIKPIEPDFYLKRLKKPIFHLAVSINSEVYKPMEGKKEHDIAFLGAVNPSTIYSFRHEVWKQLPEFAKRNKWKAIIRGRPRGKSWRREIKELLKRGEIVGSKYVETLARSKVFIFGLGRFKYPCLKFPEGMATKTCVMSDPPLTANEMHYIPDWNFVSINSKNWKQRLRYYLRHDEAREEIARNGYETFLKYHTNDIRAKQMVRFLERHK